MKIAAAAAVQGYVIVFVWNLGLDIKISIKVCKCISCCKCGIWRKFNFPQGGLYAMGPSTTSVPFLKLQRQDVLPPLIHVLQKIFHFLFLAFIFWLLIKNTQIICIIMLICPCIHLPSAEVSTTWWNILSVNALPPSKTKPGYYRRRKNCPFPSHSLSLLYYIESLGYPHHQKSPQ